MADEGTIATTTPPTAPSEHTGLDFYGAMNAFQGLLDQAADDAPTEPAPLPQKRPQPTEQTPASPEGEESEEELTPEPVEDDQPSDEDEEETPPDDESSPTLYTVKVDGKEERVTMDELLRGYSAQSYLGKRTREVAEKERVAEQARTEAIQNGQRYVQGLQYLESQMTEALGQEPDWNRLRTELSRDDYLDKRDEWELGQRRIAKVAQERQQAEDQVKREQQAAFQTHLANEERLLVEKVPAWRDTAKAKAEIGEIQSYLLTQGFTDQQVNSIHSHAAMVIARKAYLYDKLQSSGKKKAVDAQISAAKKAPPPLRPGSTNSQRTPVTDVTRAKQRLAKTHKESDAAAVFKAQLDAEDMQAGRIPR